MSSKNKDFSESFIMECQAADIWRLFSVITLPLSFWFLNVTALINLYISQNSSLDCPNSDPVYCPWNVVSFVYNFNSTYYRILF